MLGTPNFGPVSPPLPTSTPVIGKPKFATTAPAAPAPAAAAGQGVAGAQLTGAVGG